MVQGHLKECQTVPSSIKFLLIYADNGYIPFDICCYGLPSPSNFARFYKLNVVSFALWLAQGDPHPQYNTALTINDSYCYLSKISTWCDSHMRESHQQRAGSGYGTILILNKKTILAPV